jgi:hypothetical protein
MVAGTASRVRPAASNVTSIPVIRKRRRPNATWVLIGVPVVLLLTLLWQLVSSTFHSEIAVHQAVSVGQITLESDTGGSRVDFVVVDRVGQDTTVNGNLLLKVREPDGAVWQTSRTVSASDFQPLADSSLLAGRQGYSVFIPASDWARPPRRGGTSRVTVQITPSDDSDAFSATSDQRFP